MKVSSFKQFLEEEDSKAIVQTGINSKGIDNNVTKEIINSRLALVTNHEFLTPYIALGSISRVLAYANIIVPQYTFLDRHEGEVVFDATQFGKMFGVNTDGTKVPSESGHFVYFSYVMNDDGYYDCFAALVDQDELDDILDIEGEDEEDVDKIGVEQKVNEDSSFKKKISLNEFLPAVATRLGPSAAAILRGIAKPKPNPAPSPTIPTIPKPANDPGKVVPLKPSEPVRPANPPTSPPKEVPHPANDPVPKPPQVPTKPPKELPKPANDPLKPLKEPEPAPIPAAPEPAPSPWSPWLPAPGHTPHRPPAPAPRPEPAPAPAPRRVPEPAPEPAPAPAPAQRPEPAPAPSSTPSPAPSSAPAPRPKPTRPPKTKKPRTPFILSVPDGQPEKRDYLGVAAERGPWMELLKQQGHLQAPDPTQIPRPSTVQRYSRDPMGQITNSYDPTLNEEMHPRQKIPNGAFVKVTNSRDSNRHEVVGFEPGEHPAQDTYYTVTHLREPGSRTKFTRSPPKKYDNPGIPDLPGIPRAAAQIHKLNPSNTTNEEHLHENAKWEKEEGTHMPALNQSGLEAHKNAADWHTREYLRAEESGDTKKQLFHKRRMEHHLFRDGMIHLMVRDIKEEVESIDERKSSDPRGLAYKVTAASHAANPEWGPPDHTQDPQTHFGTAATRSSTLAAIKAIRGIKKFDVNNPEHVEAVSRAIHGSPSDYEGNARGWSQTAMTHPAQTDAQKERRAKLTGPYDDLSEPEKEKDRQIARTVATNIKKK